jgi:hypothetical protein
VWRWQQQEGGVRRRFIFNIISDIWQAGRDRQEETPLQGTKTSKTRLCSKLFVLHVIFEVKFKTDHFKISTVALKKLFYLKYLK